MLFITGTGTGVGKTIVTGALLRALRKCGINAVSMKPVQTGAVLAGGKWRSPDLDLHLEAAELQLDDTLYHAMCPYLYERACSPHLAGRLDERYPDMERIVELANSLASGFQCLLIEGAGGLLAPLDEDHTMLDLARALQCPVLVVAATGLGTINHSLLTLQALRAAEIPVAGMVFNQCAPVADRLIEEDNPATVAHFGEVEVHGILQYRSAWPLPWDEWVKDLCGVDAILEAMA